MTTYGPYPARVADLHDGDTLHLDVSLGFGVEARSHDCITGAPILACRVLGINAPELSTAEGKAALAYAESICPPGTIVTVVSHSWDKFGGRWDGSITLPQPHTAGGYTGTDFAALMIAAGQAVAYSG